MTEQRPRRILVAEDDAERLKAIVSRLEQEGFKVLEAQDGLEALDRAREEVPDAIILNLLLRRIEEAARYIPIENLALSPQCGFASVAGEVEQTETYLLHAAALVARRRGERYWADHIRKHHLEATCERPE